MLAGVVVLSLMLGSGRETWSLGAVACLMGVAVMLAPPLFKLPAVPALSLLWIGLLPLAGWLPVAWFGGPASWRTMLAESWDIYLPATLSPDPQAAFESWLVMASAAVWLWICLGQRPSEHGRRLCIYGLAGGGALIALASWIDYAFIPISWWPRNIMESFGPFTNRNHASSLNAISAMLCAASAYDAYRRKSRWAWLFVLSFWLPFCAIFLNTSRGGLLLLFFGLTAWLTTAAMQKGLLRKLAVGAAVVMVVASVALVSSGRLGERLRSLAQEEKTSLLTSSLRFDLARETLSLSATSPWFGQGFDSFKQVFPIITSLHTPNFKLLHPESDVLLLLFEGGILALIPCGLLLLWVARPGGWRSRKTRTDDGMDRPDRRLRQAAAIGACMALLHSVFDVPNHGVGYGLHTALLLGLAVYPRVLTLPASRLQFWILRLAGGGIFGLGIMWLGTGLQKWTPPLPSSVLFLRNQIQAEYALGHYRDCLKMTNRAIQLAPLDADLYYLRAQFLLLLKQHPDRALLDFGRSRTLEPRFATDCYQEGVYWLSFAPELAVIPWRECLRRHIPGSTQLRDVYTNMLDKAMPFPELRAPLWSLADTSEMQIVFLRHTTKGSEWEEYLARFLDLHPKIELLKPREIQTFLRVWHDLGDRSALVRLLETHQGLQSYGWKTMALELAREGRFEEAFLVAVKHVKKPQRPTRTSSTDLARLERSVVFNPTDIRAGIDLYFAYRANGDMDAARSTAEKVVALPEVPAYMKVELAALYAEEKNYRRAWETLEQTMYSHPDL
jgi:O-antigen ligase/tetratricopeptide (TPR) repeat protein